MSGREIIHIQLSYEEGLEAKKDILKSQLDLLQTLKAVKRYQALRLEELKLKIKLHRKIKEFLTQVRKMEKFLPKVDADKELKRKEEKKTEIKKVVKEKLAKEKTIEEKIDELTLEHSSDIDSELESIRKKLAALQ